MDLPSVARSMIRAHHGESQAGNSTRLSPVVEIGSKVEQQTHKLNLVPLKREEQHWMMA